MNKRASGAEPVMNCSAARAHSIAWSNGSVFCARNSSRAHRRIGSLDESSTSSRSVAELRSLFCWSSCTGARANTRTPFPGCSGTAPGCKGSHQARRNLQNLIRDCDLLRRVCHRQGHGREGATDQAEVRTRYSSLYVDFDARTGL